MLFQKIKQRYKQNLLESFIKNNDLVSIKQTLKSNFLESRKIDIQNLMNYLTFFTSQQKYENVFLKNLIWINSFEKEDYQYLSNFINEYFFAQEINFNKAKEYHLLLEEIADHYSLSKIDFMDMSAHNYVFQFLISENDPNKFKIINTSNVFYETDQKLYFTHYYLTKSFIYITRNPYTLLKKYKSRNHQDNSVNHLQGLLIGENSKKYYSEQDRLIEENIQSWSVNNHSWSNINVINTFRGLVIKYESLENNTFDTLTQVVSHLIQSGLNLKLDYGFIENYTENNPFPIHNYENFDISKQEKKLLDRDNLQVMQELSYT